jgi:hypothetical protein
MKKLNQKFLLNDAPVKYNAREEAEKLFTLSKDLHGSWYLFGPGITNLELYIEYAAALSTKNRIIEQLIPILQKAYEAGLRDK